MILKTSNVFEFVSISDIHLGSRRNTAKEIICNLKREFKDDERFASLDAIFIVGDVFDRRLSGEEILEVLVWISDLSRLAKKHDVAIRILKGTPSHDWNQSEAFEIIDRHIAKIGADIRYFKDLTIWYEEKFDMNFLFVPDEWSNSTDKTLDQTRELLRKKGLQKVDYAFMHGNFEYQLPSFVRAQKHESKAYLDIVKHLIFIGHIHTYSNFERIYAQGSFDRMSHGEEEKKGYLRVSAFKDGHHDVRFIENTGAKRFVTIDCTGLDIRQTIQKATEVASQLPPGSYVKIKAEYEHPVFANMDDVLKTLPHCVWTKDPIASNKKITKEDIVDENIPTSVEITPVNIKQLMVERIDKLKMESNVFERSKYYLDEVLSSGATR